MRVAGARNFGSTGSVRSPRAGRIVLSLLASTVAVSLFAGPSVFGADPAEPRIRERNVIRKQLPKTLKSLALEYTVVAVDERGNEKTIDPSVHTFQVGDSFLLRIKPQDDVYVYVFNEGPTGERACLLPETDEKVPLVKSGQEISLPADGGFFTFSEPAGEEKLVVVALTEPSEEMRLLSNAVFMSGHTGEGKLTSAERAVKQQADAAMEELRKRSADGTRSRGPVRKVVERSEQISPGQRITHVEPPQAGEASSYGISVSAGSPELFLDIPLRSRATADN